MSWGRISQKKIKRLKLLSVSLSLSFSRSSLTCPHCLKQSNTFDPFLCISLPIPLRQTRWGITHTQQVVELKVYCWKQRCLNYGHHSCESICQVQSSKLCFIYLLQAPVHKQNCLVKQKPLLAAGKSTLDVWGCHLISMIWIWPSDWFTSTNKQNIDPSRWL